VCVLLRGVSWSADRRSTSFSLIPSWNEFPKPFELTPCPPLPFHFFPGLLARKPFRLAASSSARTHPESPFIYFLPLFFLILFLFAFYLGLPSYVRGGLASGIMKVFPLTWLSVVPQIPPTDGRGLTCRLLAAASSLFFLLSASTSRTSSCVLPTHVGQQAPLLCLSLSFFGYGLIPLTTTVFFSISAALDDLRAHSLSCE